MNVIVVVVVVVVMMLCGRHCRDGLSPSRIQERNIKNKERERRVSCSCLSFFEKTT